MTDDTPLQLGWEEWIALPDLGLPALKAKVDTGARTSALHAYDIEPFGPATAPKVRFMMHPIPSRPDLAIACSAPILDRREVTSSNGETELRYVIESPLQVGGRAWPIEITLTDRGAMAYRMLLGRQAFRDHAVVVPGQSFCQPRLSFDVYHSTRMREVAPDRALRVAVLSREAAGYTTRRIVEEGERRGHTVEVIDTLRCYMTLGALSPEIHYDGKRLPHYDAVIPRIGVTITPYGTAVLRQFETIGTWSVNPSAGITASRDKLHAHQVLARQKIGMPTTAFAASPKDNGNLIGLVGTAPLVVKLLDPSQGRGVVLAETRKAAESVIDAFRGLSANFLVQDFVREAAGEDIRCLVMDGKVVAALRRVADPGETRTSLQRGGKAQSVKLSRAERDAALRAARAFKLGLADVDLLRGADGPKVIGVNAAPNFEGMERVSRKDLCVLLWEMVERHARPAPVRRSRSRRAG